MRDEPQIIRAPGGAEMVVLSRADYDDLVARAEDLDEDAADAAIYDARKAALAVDPDGVLPADVSAAMLKGDRLLKALRRRAGLTQVQLAEATGLSQSYLSEIEKGEKTAPAETIGKIAAALDVPVAWVAALAG